jgi:hypothetical protein
MSQGGFRRGKKLSRDNTPEEKESIDAPGKRFDSAPEKTESTLSFMQ